MKKTVSLGVIAALLVAVACRKPDSAAPAATAAPGATTPAPAAPAQSGIPPALAKLTPNELKWGISPTRNDKVTYQPDVIIMEHGSDAVRGMATNGVTWTIDATAPGASDIEVDKILFATGRVMGRVLKADHTPAGIEVTLGPVEITDVIKDCDITSDQPIDIGSAIVYTAADFPGATTTDAPEQTGLADPQVPTFFASYGSRAAFDPGEQRRHGVANAALSRAADR